MLTLSEDRLASERMPVWHGAGKPARCDFARWLAGADARDSAEHGSEFSDPLWQRMAPCADAMISREGRISVAQDAIEHFVRRGVTR
jgi:hypothetical protein